MSSHDYHMMIDRLGYLPSDDAIVPEPSLLGVIRIVVHHHFLLDSKLGREGGRERGRERRREGERGREEGMEEWRERGRERE